MERLVVIVVAVAFYLIYRALRGKTPVSRTQAANPSFKSYPFSEILPDPNLPKARSIRSKVRGVTKRNADKSDRQRIIRQSCNSGDALCFVREPNNPFDRNAIQVRRIVCSGAPVKPQIGDQLGYLSRDLAEELARRLDNEGFVLMAEILNVSGGHGSENVGVNFEMSVYMPVREAPPHPQHKKRKPREKVRSELIS